MPVYSYKATNRNTEQVEGTVEALSDVIAAEQLTSRGLIVISLEEKKSTDIMTMLPFLNAITPKDLVLFSRQLAVMASANVPIVQALNILAEQTVNPRMKQVVSVIATEVDGGSKLSESFERHPRVFSNFFVSMVRSGETSGKLDEVLTYLADQQEKDYDMQSKIKGAMIYPVFIVVGLVAVGFVMSIFVLPKLTSILTESGADLPATTQILVFISSFMQSYWWIVLFGLIAAVAGFRFLTGQGGALQAQWDGVKLRLPIFGKLFQRLYIVRITRSLSTLISGGVPLTASLTITSQVVDNATYRQLLEQTVAEVEDGRSITSLFLAHPQVPVMVSQMMKVGEQTGRLDDILRKLSGFYTRELENIVANLVTLLEPLIMLIMGGAVGFVVISIILPLYNLSASF